MQYSSLIRDIYAKTLAMDLNVLENETEISVLCKAHFNIIVLSNRWNNLEVHLCLDSKHLSGHCRTALASGLSTPYTWWEAPGSDTKPACSCGRWHPKVSQRGHLSRTKAAHSFLISGGKKGWRLPLTKAEFGLACKSSQRYVFRLLILH